MNESWSRLGTLSLIVCIVLLQSACGMGFVAEKSVELSHVVGEDFQRLAVSNTNGEIKIVGAETDALEVRAKVIVRARTQKLADANLENVDVILEESSRDLILKANTPKVTFGVNYTVNYEVSCPNHLALSLQTTNGKLLSQGMRGGVDAVSTNGEIHLDNVEGRVKAKTTNGRVHGSVLTLSEIGEFTTVNGQIDIHFQECNAPISGSAVNGQVKLSLPNNFAGRVDASVVNGNVRCEFDLQEEDSGRRHLRGRIGEGGDAMIRLSAVNGQVRIEKS